MISSGEQLRVTPEIRRLCSANPGLVLENQYGPTETHVAASYTMTGSPEDFPTLPPIGTAIDGATISVLGADLRPVPPGIERRDLPRGPLPRTRLRGTARPHRRAVRHDRRARREDVPHR